MLKCILCVGIPGSGKSTWAKAEVSKDPANWVRINNDDLRAMMNGSVWSAEYEKMIGDVRNYLIRDAFKKHKNVIIDNLNLNRRHFDDVCKIAKQSNRDIQVFEKTFYIPIEEAVARDSTREGKSKVGEEVVRKWYKESGKEQFKYYKSRVQIFTTNNTTTDIAPMVQDTNLPRAVVFDNDGTISLLNGRNPYDASTSDQDLPHAHVIECLKLYHKAGYKILFVSGREEKDRAPTERFYQKYFPEIAYELFMRPTGSMEKDVIIKERIFNKDIKDKYYVAGWFDDRLQVCRWIHENGLPLFRVGSPDSDF